jgi:hypothetical protein
MSDARSGTEPTTAQIEHGADLAEEIFDELLEDGRIPAEPSLLMHPLWILLTRFLISCGWTSEELLNDCGYHAAAQETDQARPT